MMVPSEAHEYIEIQPCEQVLKEEEVPAASRGDPFPAARWEATSTAGLCVAASWKAQDPPWWIPSIGEPTTHWHSHW